ncbi:MAG: SLC26A/SulP transporter family protein [Candidatus Rokubacteria bacterium]|nr:SLC26A/SulP transporter family protein [Candidatus Rokubacteria bacterium]
MSIRGQGRTEAINPASLPGSKSPLFGLGPNLAGGTVCALVTLSYALSYAAFIFSGKDLEPHLPVGLHAALTATWLTALVVALGSSFRFAIAGADSNATASLALISASLSAKLAAEGVTDQRLAATVLMMLMISAVWAGLVVFLLGALRRGGLVRFIPYPVAGGFLAGTGFLIVSGGLKLLTAPPHVPMLAWLIAGLVAIALLVLPRLSNHYLVIPGVLAAGVLLFYVALMLSGSDVAAARDQGLLLKPLAPFSAPLPSAATFAQVQWDDLFAQWQNFLAMTVIVVVTILLNATGLELATRRDVDFDRELRINGIANILSGLTGGMVGYLSFTRTSLNFKAGALSRLAGVWTAILCLGATFWFTPLLSYVPVPVLSGLLLYLGISELLEWVWDSYFRLPLIEYGLILTILLLMATRGLITGVAFGVLVASIFFVYRYSRISCVKNSVSGSAHFSNKERPLEQIGLLKEKGDATRALTLQGYIFFGTSTMIVDACRDLLARGGLRYLLLDFRMVQGLDVSAVWSFIKLEQLCSRAGATLVFSGISQTLHTILKQAQFFPRPGIMLFSDLDHGLEWIEDHLLAQDAETSRQASQDTVDLRRILSEHFRPEALDALIGYCETFNLQPNAPLFRQGDPGDALYFVETGRVSVLISLGDGQTKRLRAYGPGTVVGEMAVYSKHPRSADVLTDVPCRIRKLSAENLARMEREHPDVAIQFHTFVIKLLSSRLALANEEILSVL